MRFGPDLNAYTSFDETVYMLQVPADDPAIMTQAFQILEDFAHAVSFEGEEIDKERGVVIEEWRTGRGAFGRAAAAGAIAGRAGERSRAAESWRHARSRRDADCR